MGTYVFDNGWEQERERLSGIEGQLDPGTTRHLDAIGVSAGWTCLEIGGGGGSISAWLCHRVGKNGRVVATDLDTRFLDALHEPNLEVLRHDIVADDLPGESFDLIHARLLLEHLPDREQVLKRLVGALKPGGWILIEDLDFRPMLARPPIMVVDPPSDVRRYVRVWRGAVAAMRHAGYDAEFGARLVPLFVAQGLEDVGAEARSLMYRGGTPAASVNRWSLTHLRDRIVEAKLVTERDIDWAIASSNDPNRRMMWPPLIAAWGRRPSGAREPRAEGSLPSRAAGVLDRLQGLPLFAGCTLDQLNRTAALAREVQVEAGNALTREGEPGDLFYVVLQGTATVTREGQKLATLGPGSFFGETALLTGGPRTATVTADAPMTLAGLDRDGFDAVLNEAPTVARRILEGVAERSSGTLIWP